MQVHGWIIMEGYDWWTNQDTDETVRLRRTPQRLVDHGHHVREEERVDVFS